MKRELSGRGRGGSEKSTNIVSTLQFVHTLSNSPMTALGILHRASLCSESKKKKQAYKQRWRTTQSETFLEQLESGMSFWGGLINHMSSYISKEGG